MAATESSKRMRWTEAEFQEYHKDAHEITFHNKTGDCLSATYYTAAGLQEKELREFLTEVKRREENS